MKKTAQSQLRLNFYGGLTVTPIELFFPICPLIGEEQMDTNFQVNPLMFVLFTYNALLFLKNSIFAEQNLIGKNIRKKNHESSHPST